MAKTRWQRFLVIAMGSVMNIVLAVVLVAVINMVGVTVPEYLDEQPVIGWIDAGSPGREGGPQDRRRNPDDQPARRSRPGATSRSPSAPAREKRRPSKSSRDGGRARRASDREGQKTSRFDLGYAGFYGKILTQVQMVTPGVAGRERRAAGRRRDPGHQRRARLLLTSSSRSSRKTPEQGAGRSTSSATARPVTLRGHAAARGQSRQDRRSPGHRNPSSRNIGFFGAVEPERQGEREDCSSLVVDFIKNLFTGRGLGPAELGRPARDRQHVLCLPARWDSSRS